MNEDLLGYNDMVETAMRSVVRQALEKAATDGLPGEHHFYITFKTEHPDVTIPDSLRERYPEEMTIVLQHQFWELLSDADGFSVELSFNHKREYLRIPFDALITFADPSVNFGLQFHVDPDSEDLGAIDTEFADYSEDEELLAEAPKAATDEATDKDKADGDKDNVVTLDAFRKK